MSNPSSPFSLSPLMQNVKLIAPKSHRSSQLKPLGKELRISKHAINNTRDVLMQANLKSSTRNDSAREKDLFGLNSNSASILIERLDSPVAVSSGHRRIKRVSKKEFTVSLSSATYGTKEDQGSSLTNISAKETFYPSFMIKRENKKEREENTERALKVKQYMLDYKQLTEKMGKDEPSSKKCRLSRKILETLSLENGQYQDEMKLLSQDFDSSVYCNSQNILEKLERNFPGMSVENSLFPQPYFELLKKLMKFMDMYKKGVMMKFDQKDSEIHNLTEQLIEKDKTIGELKYFIDSKPPSLEDVLLRELKELVPQVEELQKSKQLLTKEIQQAKEQVDSMAEKIQNEIKDYYENRINDVINEKDAIKEEIKDKDMMIKELRLSIQKYATLQKGSVIKLQAVKDENEAMRQRISFLEDENSKLCIRAAIGFEGLTPRPELSQVFQHFNISTKKTAKLNTEKKIQLINKAIEKSNEKTVADESREKDLNVG